MTEVQCEKIIDNMDKIAVRAMAILDDLNAYGMTSKEDLGRWKISDAKLMQQKA